MRNYENDEKAEQIMNHGENDDQLQNMANVDD